MKISEIIGKIKLNGKRRQNIDSVRLMSWRDSLINRINAKYTADSLEILKSGQAHVGSAERSLDSLRVISDSLNIKVANKSGQLLASANSRVSSWESNIQSKIMDSLGFKTDSVSFTTLVEKELASLVPLTLPDLSELDVELKRFTELGYDFSVPANLNFDPGIEDIVAPGSLSDFGIKEDMVIKSIEPAIEELKLVPKEVEIPTESSALEKLKKQAVDHFSGKGEVLENAMEKISRYKGKVSTLKSLQDFDKIKRTNPMKGLRFFDRAFFGLSIQPKTIGSGAIDFEFYCLYKLSGRSSIGLGPMYRFTYHENSRNATSLRLTGNRTFFEFGRWRNFIPRIEVEVTDGASRSDKLPNNGYSITREQLNVSAFIGFRKPYKLYRNIKGTAFLLLSVYNSGNSVHLGQVTSRAGFEFQFPSKKKQPTTL